MRFLMKEGVIRIFFRKSGDGEDIILWLIWVIGREEILVYIIIDDGN